MAENSSIEWTTHTFNPWIGCSKVSAGCAHCYAETLMDKRYGKVKWGPNGTRNRTSASNWKQPLKWNREAEGATDRPRVFCASLADVYEDRPELMPWRIDLFRLIDRTPNLDWLLLTKRPENIGRFTIKTPWDYCRRCGAFSDLSDEDQRERLFKLDANDDGWVCRKCNISASYYRRNVWFGTSVESAQWKSRIDHLRGIPAAVRFLSIEPLLEDVGELDLTGIGWVIVGGESGPNARPMHPDWARTIRNQCQAAGVALHFKQWGEWEPGEPDAQPPFWNFQGGGMVDGHSFPDFTCHDYPSWDYDLESGVVWRRVGKKAAGRLLDGRTWDEYPQPVEAVR